MKKESPTKAGLFLTCTIILKINYLNNGTLKNNS